MGNITFKQCAFKTSKDYYFVYIYWLV